MDNERKIDKCFFCDKELQWFEVHSLSVQASLAATFDTHVFSTESCCFGCIEK